MATDYDVLGRPARTTATIDGTSYTSITTYDDIGRVDTSTYPGGHVSAHNVYNEHGYLSGIAREDTGELLWRADDAGAQGSCAYRDLRQRPHHRTRLRTSTAE